MTHRAVFAAGADLVVINADIRTIDKANPRAAALAVVKNRISAVGSNEEIRRLISEKTKVLDAGGKLVLPGFNDAHVHFMAMGKQFFSVDLRDAKSLPEVAEKVMRHARFLPAGVWILGHGWNDALRTAGDPSPKNLLDAAAPAHPVFLYHADAKTALVNSLALRAAQIEAGAKTPVDAGVVRDARGAATGVLTGAAVDFVRRRAPQYATDDNAAVAETAGNYAAAFGVTSVQDLSADDHAAVFRELQSKGKLKARVYDCIGLSDWRKLARENVRRADGDAFVRRGCLKGSADGDVDSNARLFEEIAAADRAGLQVTVHAIGARANEQILSVFERVTKAHGARDRRLRVEHAHGFRHSDVRRFAAAGIIASVQPFLFSDGAGRSFDSLRDLLNSKAALAFGSDSSIIAIDPLSGIAAAVNTRDANQKLTVAEAVRAYTLGSAYAEFQETEKGSISVGKLADFVILSDDILTIDPGRISRTKVLKTILNGKIVYELEE